MVTNKCRIGTWMLSVLATLASVVAGAQTDQPPTGTGSAGSQTPASSSSASTVGVLPTSTTDSETGYIDNAIVGTRVRVRVDAGADIDKPDRAEFFYAKCGCFIGDDPSAPGPIGTPVDFDGDGNISMAEVLASPLIENALDYQELSVDLEYAFSHNMSVFVELPFRRIDGAAIGSASGIGDIRAGLKYALVNNGQRAITLQLRGYFPSGDADEGLGTDHSSIEPGILYFQRLAPLTTLSGELRYWVPLDGSSGAGTGQSGGYDGEVLRWGLGLSHDFILASGQRMTPIVEVVGWSVLDGLSITSPDRTPNNAVVDKADDTIVNLKLGLRWEFAKGKSIYAGYGKALTSEVWYDDIFRLEYRATR